MDLKGFVDKAKQAMNTPAGPSPPQTEAGAENPLVVTGDTPPPAPVSLSSKLTELSNLGGEKLQELVNSFQQAQPALVYAGYELTEFEIELGVTPKLIPHFRHAPRSAEDIGTAKEMLQNNKLGQMMLGALLKAGEVHKQINVNGFGFSHIEIELGLIPSIRLQYKKD